MQRHEKISNIFNELFHSNVNSFTSRCPGRVNLIGEHIDYNGYSVLPCALENDIIIKSMIRNNESNSSFEIIIHNTNSVVYSSYNINVLDRLNELNNKQLTNNKSIVWTDYILCGLIAILGLIQDVNTNEDIYNIIKINLISKQLCILVDGNIIESSGLSSSSALVVSSALSFSKCLLPFISNLPSTISSEVLAAQCVDSERMVGTLGGGMDQTVCVLANENSALHIFFIPKTVVINVKLPSNLSLIICHCFVSSEKAQGGKLAFNTKVVECRIAALLITKLIDSNKCNKNNFPLSLGDAECVLLGNNILPVNHIEYIDSAITRLDKMIKFTEEIFHDEDYSINEIYSVLGLTYNVDSIADIFFKDKRHKAAKEVLNQDIPIFFKLKNCAIHVYSGK
jgi:galactokinase